MSTFHIASMSPLILGLTLMLFAIPFGFISTYLFGHTILIGPGIILLMLYAWVWLRYRPSRFVIHPDKLEIIWPLKRRYLERRKITSVQIIDSKKLQQEAGWCVRIGVGGLWGAFGWLWTKHRGIVQMYISRMDDFVWIECVDGRPWLITPENPEFFVRELSNK